MLYIKEFEERDMFLLWSKLFFFLLEEKEIGEGCIDEVRVFPGKGDEVQTLPSGVTSSPECFRLFQVPWHLIVWLDGKHVKCYPEDKATYG